MNRGCRQNGAYTTFFTCALVIQDIGNIEIPIMRGRCKIVIKCVENVSNDNNFCSTTSFAGVIIC